MANQRQYDSRDGFRRVEEQLGSKRKPGPRFIVTAEARRLALEQDACLRILEECGHLRKGAPISVVRLIDVPEGLDANETERFLRERGAEIRFMAS